MLAIGAREWDRMVTSISATNVAGTYAKRNAWSDREEAEWRKRVRHGSPVPLLTLGRWSGLHSPECHTWSNWLALLTDGLRTTEWWLRYSSASVPPRRAFMEAIAFLQVIVVLERIVVHASAGAYPGRARAKGLFEEKRHAFRTRELSKLLGFTAISLEQLIALFSWKILMNKLTLSLSIFIPLHGCFTCFMIKAC